MMVGIGAGNLPGIRFEGWSTAAGLREGRKPLESYAERLVGRLR